MHANGHLDIPTLESWLWEAEGERAQADRELYQALGSLGLVLE
ncbi:MAG: hypothetical protein Q8O86_02165 [Dehalococcoidia bacterium]|nr:hypothetical protein [Dehalococcoidia bacterium]